MAGGKNQDFCVEPTEMKNLTASLVLMHLPPLKTTLGDVNCAGVVNFQISKLLPIMSNFFMSIRTSITVHSIVNKANMHNFRANPLLLYS